MKLNNLLASYIPALRSGVPVLLILILTACSDSDDIGLFNNTFQSYSNCPVAVEKQEVLDIMQEWYLWNDVAGQSDKYLNIDLTDYSDGFDLLNHLRYQPSSYDRGFSYISEPADDDAYFAEGQYVGFGFGLSPAVYGNVYITQVFAGSPAADAGVERGYRIVSIDGYSVSDIVYYGNLNAALGASETGISRQFVFEDQSGVELAPVVLSKEVVTIDAVPVASIIRDGGGNAIAGYLLFRTFISSADDELRAAFATFAAEPVDTLIVDLRYNGGGLVSTSTVLASLLAGPGNVGNIYANFEYNSARSAENNTSLVFSTEPDAIALNTIIFLTTGDTASASELVINGLSPYFMNPNEVVIIGSRTFGKPVGQSSFDFCGGSLRLRPVTFSSANVNGDSDYFSGLPATCAATDNYRGVLGDESESMLAAALAYLDSGLCTLAADTRSIQNYTGDPVRHLPKESTAQQFAGAY